MRFSAHRSAVSPRKSPDESTALVKEYCANFCTVKMLLLFNTTLFYISVLLVDKSD